MAIVVETRCLAVFVRVFEDKKKEQSSFLIFFLGVMYEGVSGRLGTDCVLLMNMYAVCVIHSS